uniref:(northern house mosquito) hypothetical protein n=1 Tax=Culex pipiens TaxID=7175 RepID=A0A8D8P046_CULPI
MSKTITTRDNHQILFVFCHLLRLSGALDIYISRDSLSVLRCTSFTYENYFPFLICFFFKITIKTHILFACISTLPIVTWGRFGEKEGGFIFRMFRLLEIVWTHTVLHCLIFVWVSYDK